MHHAGVILVHGPIPFARRICGPSMLAYLMELSTPFVNNRWFLAESKNSPLAKMHPALWADLNLWNGLAIVLSFFCCRVLNSPYLVYCVWSLRNPLQTEMPLFFWNTFLLACMFVYLNFKWFYAISKGAMKLIRGGAVAYGEHPRRKERLQKDGQQREGEQKSRVD